jgi:hypothetical protein
VNIPSILERLLLSNEAVFKNATLGLSGQNMVYVPPGKTAVLLEFSIEPFVNDISQDNLDLFIDGFSQSTFKDSFIRLRNRLCYQMQIINDTYSTYFSFHDCFSVVNNVTGVAQSNASISLNFLGKREEIFIYTDRSMYFNFIYPFRDGNNNDSSLTPLYGTPAAAFTPKIQDLPSNPITFKGNTAEDFVVEVQVGSSTDAYFPVGKQIVSSLGFDNDAQQEYLHFANETAFPASSNTIRQPQPNDDALLMSDLFKVPLVNVKYALINKRASDYGIVAPKNL